MDTLRCHICGKEMKGNLRKDRVVVCSKCVLNGRLSKGTNASKSHEDTSKFNFKAFSRELNEKKKRRVTEDSRPLPENWNKIKKAVKTRDKYSCRSCGSKLGLTVHHIIPRDESGSNEPRNLMTLCGFCHNDIEVEGVQGWDNLIDYKKKLCGAI